jgi:hypothetical protein
MGNAFNIFTAFFAAIGSFLFGYVSCLVVCCTPTLSTDMIGVYLRSLLYAVTDWSLQWHYSVGYGRSFLQGEIPP